MASKYYQKKETREERSKSSMANIRNYHNDVKKYCYTQASKITKISNLLDIGAGRGGDLSKYNASSVPFVVAMDIHVQDLNELLQRFAKARYSFPKVLRTVCGNMSVVDFSSHFKYPKRSFECISCQFAIHYAFENVRKLWTFFNNINEYLAPGGVFMATFLDGETVYKRLAQNNGRLDFGYASIVAKYDPKTRYDAGMAIDVQIASISEHPKTEYLVDYEFLKNTMLNEFGIQVIESNMFVPVSLCSKDAEYSSLHRYVIMRKLPPPPVKPIKTDT